MLSCESGSFNSFTIFKYLCHLITVEPDLCKGCAFILNSIRPVASKADRLTPTSESESGDVLLDLIPKGQLKLYTSLSVCKC